LISIPLVRVKTILMPDTLRFICAANEYDPTKIGQHFLEVLPKVCPPEEEHKLRL